MKKLVFGSALLALGGLFANAAMAETVALTSCTRDKKIAILLFDVAGSVKNGPSLKTLAQTSFDKTAGEMNAALLVSPIGAEEFFWNLETLMHGKELSENANYHRGAPPIIDSVGACTVPGRSLKW